MTLRRPGPRLTMGLLIASVCLNLFAVGALGAALIWRSDRHGPGFGFVERAPDNVRPMLRQAFDERRDAIREQMDAVRAARSEIGRLLESGETDTERLQAAFAQMRTAFDGVESLAHDAIVATIPDLGPEDRAEWAEQWLRSPRR